MGYDGYNGYYPQNQMMMYPVQWPYNECGNFEYYTTDCKEHCENNFEKDKNFLDGSKENEVTCKQILDKLYMYFEYLLYYLGSYIRNITVR